MATTLIDVLSGSTVQQLLMEEPSVSSTTRKTINLWACIVPERGNALLPISTQTWEEEMFCILRPFALLLAFVLDLLTSPVRFLLGPCCGKYQGEQEAVMESIEEVGQPVQKEEEKKIDELSKKLAELQRAEAEREAAYKKELKELDEKIKRSLAGISDSTRWGTTSEEEKALAELGLDSTADGKQVKRKFHELAMRYHPDKGGPWASSYEMNKINRAMEKLGQYVKQRAGK